MLQSKDSSQFKIIEDHFNENISFPRIKICLVGANSAAGQSVWMHRLSYSEFIDGLKSTIGVDSLSSSVSSSKRNYKLLIWDCASQARFKSLNRPYISSCYVHIYFLDLNRDNSVKEVKKEYEDIRRKDSYCGQPIILVGSKVDIKKRQVSDEEAIALAKKIGASSYIECSSKKDVHVQTVVYEALRLALESADIEALHRESKLIMDPYAKDSNLRVIRESDVYDHEPLIKAENFIEEAIRDKEKLEIKLLVETENWNAILDRLSDDSQKDKVLKLIRELDTSILRELAKQNQMLNKLDSNTLTWLALQEEEIAKRIIAPASWFHSVTFGLMAPQDVRYLLKPEALDRIMRKHTKLYGVKKQPEKNEKESVSEHKQKNEKFLSSGQKKENDKGSVSEQKQEFEKRLKDLTTSPWMSMFSRKLTSLDFSGFVLDDSDAKRLAEVLKKNSTLTEIDLSKNKIGDDGAKALVNSLRENKSLSKLILKQNKITSSYANELLDKYKIIEIERTIKVLLAPTSKGAGKSIWIRSLRGDGFDHNLYPIGSDFHFLTAAAGKKKHKLQIWDIEYNQAASFPGIEKFGYIGSSLAIYFLDVSNSRSLRDVRCADKAALEHMAEETPKILVASKVDVKERKIDRDEGIALANEIGASSYIECSSKKNIHVKTVACEALRVALENASDEKYAYNWSEKPKLKIILKTDNYDCGEMRLGDENPEKKKTLSMSTKGEEHGTIKTSSDNVKKELDFTNRFNEQSKQSLVILKKNDHKTDKQESKKTINSDFSTVVTDEKYNITYPDVRVDESANVDMLASVIEDACLLEAVKKMSLIDFEKKTKTNFFGLKKKELSFLEGDCLFAAVGAVINKEADDVRKMAVNWIKKDKKLQKLIEKGCEIEKLRLQNDEEKIYSNIEEYLDLMEKPQTWGTMIELVALGRSQKRPVVILIPGNECDQLFLEKEFPTGDPIFLNYINNNHYVPLMVPEGESSADIFNAIKENIEKRNSEREVRQSPSQFNKSSDNKESVLTEEARSALLELVELGVDGIRSLKTIVAEKLKKEKEQMKKEEEKTRQLRDAFDRINSNNPMGNDVALLSCAFPYILVTKENFEQLKAELELKELNNIEHRFVNKFRMMLNHLYASSTVIQPGEISTRPTTGLIIFQSIFKMILQVPFISDFINEGLAQYDNKTTVEELKILAESSTGQANFEKKSLILGLTVSKVYKEQLEKMTYKGAESFATCGVARINEYIRYLTEVKGRKTDESLAIPSAYSYDDVDEQEKKVQEHFLFALGGLRGHVVKKGTLKIFSTEIGGKEVKIETIAKLGWLESCVYTRTGIRTEEGKFFVKRKDMEEVEKYGFRFGTEHEAKNVYRMKAVPPPDRKNEAVVVNVGKEEESSSIEMSSQHSKDVDKHPEITQASWNKMQKDLATVIATLRQLNEQEDDISCGSQAQVRARSQAKSQRRAASSRPSVDKENERDERIRLLEQQMAQILEENSSHITDSHESKEQQENLEKKREKLCSNEPSLR